MTKTQTYWRFVVSLLLLVVGFWPSRAAANVGDVRATQTPYADSAASLTVPWTPAFLDTNYTAVCTAETVPSDFLLPVITSRSAGSMNLDPTDGGSPPGTLDCIAIPDSDSSDIRHARVSFTGFPPSVTVPWSPAFPDTNYTAVCTVETQDNPAPGFTSVINAVNPGSISVINGGFDSGTMHCIAIPDSDSSGIRRSRVTVSGGQQQVMVPWNQPFADKNYAAVCSDVVPGANGSDAAIAIYANSKLTESITAIPEITSGSVYCIAVAGTLGMASYDSTLSAPLCGRVFKLCDSGPSLLLGRDNMTGGAEPNQPNTIHNSCADGTAGTFHVDESMDRLTVATTNGLSMSQGSIVRVSATVWVADPTQDALDLYYATDANNPAWIYITTLVPRGSGAQNLSALFRLRPGHFQAVRANFRKGGTRSSCSTGDYDDHDDLAFAVR